MPAIRSELLSSTLLSILYTQKCLSITFALRHSPVTADNITCYFPPEHSKATLFTVCNYTIIPPVRAVTNDHLILRLIDRMILPAFPLMGTFTLPILSKAVVRVPFHVVIVALRDRMCQVQADFKIFSFVLYEKI